MKASLVTKSGEFKGEIELPNQFTEPVRDDLISRAVLSLQSKRRTPYGAYEMAGKRQSTYNSKRRRKYRGTYGIGISRIPRKIMSRSGGHFNRVAAFAPGTVGGRRAHAPKSMKIWFERINTKENRKAIRSAMSASVTKEIVLARGHKVPDKYPIVVSGDFEEISKTLDLVNVLEKMKLSEELERSSVKKVRAGIGKRRNRKYQKRKGILFVVSKNCKLMEACKNISGVDVVNVLSLNAEHLAPGSVPGRLTL